jgi:hypothetical protein
VFGWYISKGCVNKYCVLGEVKVGDWVTSPLTGAFWPSQWTASLIALSEIPVSGSQPQMMAQITVTATPWVKNQILYFSSLAEYYEGICDLYGTYVSTSLRLIQIHD